MDKNFLGIIRHFYGLFHQSVEVSDLAGQKRRLRSIRTGVGQNICAQKWDIFQLVFQPLDKLEVRVSQIVWSRLVRFCLEFKLDKTGGFLLD